MMLFLLTLVMASALQIAGAASPDPADITEIDAINCRIDLASYTGFAMAVSGKDGIAQERRWRKVASTNAFMSEYELPSPIIVAGAYSTRRIGFTADAIVAILDLPDPATLARAEHVENAMDAAPMIDALVGTGTMTRAEAEAAVPFRKFMGERILKDVTEPAGQGERYGRHSVVARTISNATTHPGKTFYGCSYRFEMLDNDGAPL